MYLCVFCNTYCSAGPLGTVQMMLNQLGMAAGGGMTAGDRRFRWMFGGVADPLDPTAASGGSRLADSASNTRAMANVMQTLISQLLPQQHRLLALPPRVATSESAALLEQAANLQPQPQQQPQQQQQEGAAPAAEGAAPAGGDSNVRSQASTVSTLSRLVSRMNGTAAPSSSAYLRGDGRISVRHPGTGGLINVAINPSLLSPALGGNATSSLWQTLEALGAPGGLLSAGQGGGLPGLADLNDSVWDEAVSQLLEVLAPNGAGRGARMQTGGLAPPGAAGRAAAAGAADNAGLDPREFSCSQLDACLSC